MKASGRLRRSLDFRMVMRGGPAVSRSELLLYHAAGTERSRFGFVVSRRIGGAVVRNRVKRRLREAARSILPDLESPVDIVVAAKEPMVRMGTDAVRDALSDAAARAGLVRSRQGSAPR